MHTASIRLPAVQSRSLNWMPILAGLILMAVLYWAMPGQTLILTRVAILAIFVMSLDLVTGYAGLPTLGHAALYGVGAYAAGLCAMHFTADPLVGLLLAALVGGLVALVSGAFLVRYQGLTFLMLTIAVAQILQNLASKMQSVTGGDDGLSGFMVGPIFGYFEFDMFGVTGYWYSAIVLMLCYVFLRRVMRSPFGLACQGIRENRDRMQANGTQIYPYLLKLYVLSGLIAGLAGGLSAQITQVVGLDSLGFNLSAEALVMLVLGGLGNLWGAIIGTALFMGIHHFASSANPFHWLFVIGVLLMVVVFLPRGFVVRVLQRAFAPFVTMFRRRA
jgi:branched-chain amino acid transport system permease protein